MLYRKSGNNNGSKIKLFLLTFCLGCNKFNSLADLQCLFVLVVVGINKNDEAVDDKGVGNYIIYGFEWY